MLDTGNIAKHLSGKHDQKTHGRGGSREGGPQNIDTHYDAWHENLSSDEKRALAGYQNFLYSDVNATLRGKAGDLSPRTKQNVDYAIKHTDKAIGKGSVPSNVKVYRGFTDGNAILGGDPQGLVGSTIQDKAFVSTSLNKSVAVDFARKGKSGMLMEIDVPAGTKAAYMQKLRPESIERELLLGRNSRFQVTGVRKEGDLNVLQLKLAS